MDEDKFQLIKSGQLAQIKRQIKGGSQMKIPSSLWIWCWGLLGLRMTIEKDRQRTGD